jgi:hypothetical protein
VIPDVPLFASLVVAFAVLATAHLSIVVALSRCAPRWRSAVALIALPLAPYWAMRNRMYVRAVAWIAGAVAYIVALGLAVLPP